MGIEKRKDDHIDICLTCDVRTHYDHWDDVQLIHQSIPSCDLEDIDLTTEFLGKKLDAPLMITAMTGGSSKAEKYNRLLAKVADEFKIGLGVGSQRAAIEKPEYEASYSVVKEFEIPLLFGNLGAPQFSKSSKTGNGPLRQYGLAEAEKALDMIGGDALCIHLNYLQEVVQPEGETNVNGFIENLNVLCKTIPVVAKETGSGISRETALTLKEAGVVAIDVAGASGTSFSAVESYRYGNGISDVERVGRTFWDWGIPSPVSVKLANVGIPTIASGGLRNGLDIGRALGIGADIGGMAWPMLKKASEGYEGLKKELEAILKELRISLFLSGVSSVSNKSEMECVICGRSRELLDGFSSGNY